MKRILISILTIIGIVGSIRGQRFHCETDTVIVMDILRTHHDPGGDPSAKIGSIAASFVGSPFSQITKEDSIGQLEIRVDAFDEMSFLDNVVALARLSTSPGHRRINEFASALEEVSFRRGKENGFASRMIYGADWALDNKSRHIVKELTEDFSDSFKTKSLDWVTRHRGEYAALADTANYENQRMVEMGFRTHKIPHLRREAFENKEILAELKDGDIIMLLTPDQTRDTFEIGILKEREDGFHFIHPSETEGKVVEEKETIGRYIKRNAKKIYGSRWLRLN